MRGRDEDCVMGVSSLANKEPLMVVEVRVDVVREVIRKDGGDGRGGVVRKGEASLCRGGCRSFLEGSFSAEDRNVSRDRCGRGHRGSEVLASRGGDEYVVGINGDVFVKRGEEEGIGDFLSDSRRSGRHG